MKKNSVTTLISFIVIVCGFAAIFGIGSYLEKIRPELPAGYEDEDLSLQGARLKGYSFGFEGLIADWYWMKSLQYVGDKILKNPEATVSIEDLTTLNPRLLYPYLDNATTLDPQFMTAYYYGAVVLPSIDKEQAIRLVQKGIDNNPGNWRLYQHLGYIYWKLNDYEKAAEVYSQGAAINGAAPFMKLMAANMKADGGSRQTARAIYTQMLAEAEDSQTKKAIEVRLMSLDSIEERDAIHAVLRDFQQKNGRCAQSWNEILPALKNVKLPDGLEFHLDRANNLVDPSNAPYVLNKEKCDVELGKDSKVISD